MEWISLSPRARGLFYLRATVRLVVVWGPGAVVAGMACSAFISVWMGVIVGGVFGFLALMGTLWMPSLSFARWRYIVRGDDLLITRGVFLRKLTSIPTHRVQHVDVHQGPLEQWLGLARIRIHTASGIGGDGVIPGLELEKAQTLRDQLVKPSGNDGV